MLFEPIIKPPGAPPRRPPNILSYLMVNCGTTRDGLKTYRPHDAIQDDLSLVGCRRASGVCTVVAWPDAPRRRVDDGPRWASQSKAPGYSDY